jgi:glycine/D-amino acid oxidase-like deaminating enzyme
MSTATPLSYWIDEAELKRECPRLDKNGKSDIAIVGGGFSGLWTALALRERSKDTSIVIFEADFCGSGPSGRNGGIVYDLWEKFPLLLRYFSEEYSLALAEHAQEVVKSIPLFIEKNGIDADYVHKGALHISTSRFHDNKTDEKIKKLHELGKEEVSIKLSEREIATLALSPRFRGGTLYPGVFTIQPAKLIKGLRRVALESGIEIFEDTTVDGIKEGKEYNDIYLNEGLRWKADKVLVASGCPEKKLSKSNITVSSSHMVITEPVPDVLEGCNWTGGEAITDERNTVHYMRTTNDGRIAFGLGAGEIQPYGRSYSVDMKQIRTVERDLYSFFPSLLGRKVVAAWGGPIDISPTHLPLIKEGSSGIYQVGGYTGAGVGMSAVLAPILASRILDTGEEISNLLPPKARPLPPDPVRTWAGSFVRRAMLNKEESEERGVKPSLWSRAVTAVPEKIGIHIGR